MMMRVYYEYTKNSFKENMSYRIAFFVGLTQRLFMIFISLFLWQALMGQDGVASSSVGTITMSEMVTYIMITSLISIFLRNSIVMDINDRVRNGHITSDLIKPINFMGYIFTIMVSGTLYSVITQMVVIVGVIVIFFDVQAAAPVNLLFFIFSLLGAYLILFYTSFILGLLSFWYTSMWQVDTVLGALIAFFSGSWIPLWFFPPALNTIAQFLPFRLLYYMPVSIYLGKVSYSECWLVLLQQAGWILLLYAAARLMWRSAVKKLVIQGG